MPQDDMGNIDQTVLKQLQTSMTPKQSLAPVSMNPKMGQSGLGTNIGVGLLKMLVPVIGGAVQQSIKAKKEQQINEAVNDYQVLHTSYENAMVATQNDKAKADEMFGKDPRVRAILDDKKKQKLIAKAFSVDVTNPEKNQNTAHFQALKRFQDITKATESMKATAQQLEQFKAQGKGGQAQESVQGTPASMSKQPQPGNQGGGHQPQEGLPAQGEAPGQAGGDPVKNFLDKWPMQTKAPTLQDAEKASVTMKNLVEASAQGEPKTDVQMWYKAKTKELGRAPNPQEIEGHHEAMRLKPVDQAIDQAFEMAANGDVEGFKKQVDLIHTIAGAIHPQTKKNLIDLIIGSNAGDAVDTKALKTYRAMNNERAEAYGKGRAKYFYTPYVNPETHEIQVMSGLDTYEAIKRGEVWVPAGKLTAGQISTVQRMQQEIGPTGSKEYDKGAMKGVIDNISAYDNTGDRAIYARIMRTMHDDPRWSIDPTGAMKNVIDQAITAGLSPEGRSLAIQLRRMSESMGTFRSTMGLPSTDQSMSLTLSLLPGAGTPDAAFAKEQIDSLDQMVKNSIDIPTMKHLTGPTDKDKNKPKQTLEQFLNGK